MPIVYFNGGFEDEQAKGVRLDGGKMSAYAVRRDQPTDLIFLGGHRLDDAPEYNEVEGKVSNKYVKRGGRNVVVETQLSLDYAKSVTLNLMLPDVLVSVTDIIFQQQKQCIYDIVIVQDDCETGCNEFFWMGEHASFHPKRIQSSILGYDDNEAPINTQRKVRVDGELLEYKGMKLTSLGTATQAMYAALVKEEDIECDGCDCPYQIMVRGGVAPGAGDALLEYTEDGGTTWSVITTTALGADMIITDLKYVNGYLLASYSDVAQGVGTDGGVAYSFGIGPALAVSTLDVASLGIQTLEVVGGSVYAFGTGGETYQSCDDGLAFTKDTTSPITETILDSSYDNQLGTIFLACSIAEAWTFDEHFFVQIDGDFSPTAATDLESVEVLRPGGGVAFGGADGKYYQSWDFVGLAVGTWTNEDFGAGTIGAIVGDSKGYRTLIGHADDVVRRSIATKQQWRVFSETPVGNFTALESAKAFVNNGTGFYLGVTDTGETFQISECWMCLEGCS